MELWLKYSKTSKFYIVCILWNPECHSLLNCSLFKMKNHLSRGAEGKIDFNYSLCFSILYIHSERLFNIPVDVEQGWQWLGTSLRLRLLTDAVVSHMPTGFLDVTLVSLSFCISHSVCLGEEKKKLSKALVSTGQEMRVLALQLTAGECDELRERGRHPPSKKNPCVVL